MRPSPPTSQLQQHVTKRRPRVQITLARSVLITVLCFCCVANVYGQPRLQETDSRNGSRIDQRTCEGTDTPCKHIGDDQVGCVCQPANFNLQVNLSVDEVAGLGWDPSEEQLQAIQAGFNRTNSVIADASEGQFTISTITLIRNNEDTDAAIQLFAGTCDNDSNLICIQDSDCGGGTCQIRESVSPPRGWGDPQGRMEVGMDCLNDEQGRCFAHQFFHFFVGLHDEHEGLDLEEDCSGARASGFCDGGNQDQNPCDSDEQCCDANGCNATCEAVACQVNGTSSNCLMHDPTVTPGVRNDLCTIDDHDSAGITVQSQCTLNGNDTSCWGTFLVEWSNVVAFPEDGVLEPEPPLVAPIEFFDGVSDIRTVVLADRSGSMGLDTPPRIEEAIRAANDDIDEQLLDGTELGIVSFSDTISKDFPPEEGLRVLDPDSRDAAKEIVENLRNRVGGATNIGDGLRRSHQAFGEAGGTITAGSRIIMFSDGLNNRPEPNPQQDLEQAIVLLENSSLPVDVTCIGQARDAGQCAEIADRTRGRFLHSFVNAELYDALLEFIANLQNIEIAVSETGTFAEENASAALDSTTSETLVPIEPGVANVRFMVSWQGFATDIDLDLFAPDGTQVPLEQRRFGGKIELYRITAPQPGIWRMVARAVEVQANETFTMRALVDHKAVRFGASLTRTVIEWPNTFHVSANPTFGRSVSDCQIEATVQRPDQSFEVIALYDDGRNNDGDANDGLYGADYINFVTGDGFYTFLVRARCEEGRARTVSPDVVVPTFERTQRFSGLITGVPDNLPPIAKICENVHAECQGPLTEVELDGTCSFDPEGSSLSYAWSSSAGTFDDSTLATPIGIFPIGINEVNLVVTDQDGFASASDTGLVIVRDTLPPIIYDIAAEPNNLWPPDHKMVPVELALDVQDQCDPVTDCEIIYVESNEPDNGLGDGNTLPDWEINGPLSLNLRRECAGVGEGRIYSIEVACFDNRGFVTTASTEVYVVHDQGNGIVAHVH